MTGTDRISSNLEDYLETIFMLSDETAGAHTTGAHSKDIANKMGVTRASVTGALRALSELGLVDYTPYRAVRLTTKGERVARAVAERYAIVYRFMSDVLGLNTDDASAAAGVMEHGLSKPVMTRLVKFIRFFENCKHVQFVWQDDDDILCDYDPSDPQCQVCKEHAPTQ